MTNKDLDNMFLDIYRILKPGGISYHCIDAYISNNATHKTHSHHLHWIKLLERLVDKYAFRLIGENEIGNIDDLVFCPSFATNSDLMMGRWNISAPHMRATRETHQSISIKLGIQKIK